MDHTVFPNFASCPPPTPPPPLLSVSASASAIHFAFAFTSASGSASASTSASTLLSFSVVAFSVTAVLTPRVRGMIHRWLGSLGKTGTKEAEAASIAALIGGGAAALARVAAEHNHVRIAAHLEPGAWGGDHGTV